MGQEAGRQATAAAPPAAQKPPPYKPRPARLPAGTHVLSTLVGLLVLYYPFGNAVAILAPAVLGAYALLCISRRHCAAATWVACGGYLLLW